MITHSHMYNMLTQTYAHICLQAHTYAHMLTHTCSYMLTCSHTCITCLHTCTHTHSCTICLHMHNMLTHAVTHMLTYAHTHTNICLHTANVPGRKTGRVTETRGRTCSKVGCCHLDQKLPPSQWDRGLSSPFASMEFVGDLAKNSTRTAQGWIWVWNSNGDTGEVSSVYRELIEGVPCQEVAER